MKAFFFLSPLGNYVQITDSPRTRLASSQGALLSQRLPSLLVCPLLLYLSSVWFRQFLRLEDFPDSPGWVRPPVDPPVSPWCHSTDLLLCPPCPGISSGLGPPSLAGTESSHPCCWARGACLLSQACPKGHWGRLPCAGDWNLRLVSQATIPVFGNATLTGGLGLALEFRADSLKGFMKAC